MKVLDRVLDVDSTLEGERVGMTIDQGALAHIMSVLTDLYSDPELAIIREYSTNALDAHLVAGVTRPIEVQLPTALSPFLRIRDFGLGLDADDIRDIYSRYGTSTKRDSDDVVGMLGLGCKSALTYTDQFTVTGIKAGRMIQVSVGRDEDGAGSMTIVAEHDTDLPSGVEVTIPTKRVNALEAKAASFFSFWTPGSVLVNGTKPKRVDGMWIDDTLVLVKGIESDYIVMGNVAYPFDAAKIANQGYYNRTRVVKFVPIGAVQFTPSREALQMTRLTKDAIAAIDQEVKTKLNAALTKSVLTAKTPAEAITKYREAQHIGLTDKVTYQGRTIPNSISRLAAGASNYNAPTPFLTGTMQTYYRSRKKGGEWNSTVNLDGSDTLWLPGFDAKEMTAVKREKLAQYLGREHPGYTPNRWVATEHLTADERFWLDGAKIIDFSIIDAEKLPKQHKSSVTGRPRGSYKGWVNDDWQHDGIEADTIDTSRPVVYYQGNRFECEESSTYRLDLYPADGTLVTLESNRVDKFRRDFPQAQSLNEYAEQQALAWFKAQDAEDVEAARLQSLAPYGRIKRARMDATKVNDPALRVAITKALRPCEGVKAALMKYRSHLGSLPTLTLTTDPLAKYTLVNDYTPLNEEHTYLYLNAAYAAENGASA